MITVRVYYKDGTEDIQEHHSADDAWVLGVVNVVVIRDESKKAA